jgi:hypothetical protein
VHGISVESSARGARSQPATRVAPRRGELGGNRTHDPRIKSALLYRLSYELISTQFPKYHNRKGPLAARPVAGYVKDGSEGRDR